MERLMDFLVSYWFWIRARQALVLELYFTFLCEKNKRNFVLVWKSGKYHRNWWLHVRINKKFSWRNFIINEKYRKGSRITFLKKIEKTKWCFKWWWKWNIHLNNKDLFISVEYFVKSVQISIKNLDKIK